jgi:hypothetical protein
MVSRCPLFAISKERRKKSEKRRHWKHFDSGHGNSNEGAKKIVKSILFGILAVIIAASVIWCVVVWPTTPHAKNVFVIDESKSVPDDARADAHTAVAQNVGQLKRGDELVVIPLTGDAAIDAPGKVQRLRISTERKAYDADLKRANANVRLILEKLREESSAHPYLRTDLLGSISLAAEEKRPGETFNLAIISDMINDTSSINFMTHPALAREESALKFANELMSGHQKVWEGARIFLGQLRSNDLKKLGTERRQAIRAFWIEYFRAGGAVDVVFATDGPGQLAEFMGRESSAKK